MKWILNIANGFIYDSMTGKNHVVEKISKGIINFITTK